jgi:hypothetical protein
MFISLLVARLTHIDEWFRHMFFYAGQLVFLFFADQVGREFKSINNSTDSRKTTFPAIIALDFSVHKIFNFVTSQGLHHIMVLPIYFVTYGYISLRFGVQRYLYQRRMISNLLSAAGFFVLPHVLEFIIESQGKFTFLPMTFMENSELLLYLFGLALLANAIRAYSLRSKEVKHE